MSRKWTLSKCLQYFLGEINNNYPKSKRIQLIKRTNCILPHHAWVTPITGTPTFYTDANKLGKAGYRSKKLSEMDQSPYDSVQKSELYAILMVLRNLKKLSI